MRLEALRRALALALADESGLRVTILRLFNCYGPRNHLSWWGGPMVTFIEALLDGEPVDIHGDGLQTRRSRTSGHGGRASFERLIGPSREARSSTSAAPRR